jgi:hypothetical protein
MMKPGTIRWNLVLSKNPRRARSTIESPLQGAFAASI